jgi:hypothetical protein
MKRRHFVEVVEEALDYCNGVNCGLSASAHVHSSDLPKIQGAASVDTRDDLRQNSKVPGTLIRVNRLTFVPDRCARSYGVVVEQRGVFVGGL